MVYLDSSIVVVGLPTVIEDLNTSLFTGIWVIAAYGLTLTILLVAIGRMADIVGRVKLYNAGFAIFMVGSALCALSHNVEMLIAFRVVQALGGAFLVVNTLAIITDSVPISELGKATGINAMAINAGTISGYVLSGVMIGLFGWRSIFWINVPIGSFGVFWCHKRLKELYTKTPYQRYDYPGAVIFSTALTILLIALTQDLRNPFMKALVGLSGVLFLLFLIRERRLDQPILDLTLFRIRVFSAGNIAYLLNGLAFSALAFELTLYLQLVRGFSAFRAGIALLPLDFSMVLISPISGRLSDKYGARGLSAIGLAMSSVAFSALANLALDSSSFFIIASLALAGAGSGLFRSPNASTVMKSVPPERRGIANAVRQTMYNTSIVTGIPLAMTLMTAVLPYDKLASIVNVSTLSNQREALGLLSAITLAFYALAFINSLGIIASIFEKLGRWHEIVRSKSFW
jgi:EmrB/QacA subfamily drug resistance transporter